MIENISCLQVFSLDVLKFELYTVAKFLRFPDVTCPERLSLRNAVCMQWNYVLEENQCHKLNVLHQYLSLCLA